MRCLKCKSKVRKIGNDGLNLDFTCHSCNSSFRIVCGKILDARLQDRKTFAVTLEHNRYGTHGTSKFLIPHSDANVLFFPPGDQILFLVEILGQEKRIAFVYNETSYVYYDYTRNLCSTVSKQSQLMYWVVPFSVLLTLVVGKVVPPNWYWFSFFFVQVVVSEVIRLMIKSFFIPHVFPVQQYYFADKVEKFEKPEAKAC